MAVWIALTLALVAAAGAVGFASWQLHRRAEALAGAAGDWADVAASLRRARATHPSTEVRRHHIAEGAEGGAP